MKNAFRKTLSRWVEAGRKVGFLLVLVAGSAALGLLISWPLWLFATSARGAYSITVLGLAGAGILYLVVAVRAEEPHNHERPGQASPHFPFGAADGIDCAGWIQRCIPGRCLPRERTLDFRRSGPCRLGPPSVGAWTCARRGQEGPGEEPKGATGSCRKWE